MQWQAVFVDEFQEWLDEQEKGVRSAILAHVRLLKERGPLLGRPYVDSVKGSTHSNMKELRISYQGNPFRVLFAFDPVRCAVLLVGGNKAGDKRWYIENIRIADTRLSRFLNDLKE